MTAPKQPVEHEEEFTMCSIIIKVKTLADILESGTTVIFHKQFEKYHAYYYYASIGEPVTVIVLYTANNPFKRYVGLKNQKVIEDDMPGSDSPMPILDVEDDPILQSALEEEKKDAERKN